MLLTGSRAHNTNIDQELVDSLHRTVEIRWIRLSC